jgi:hypothetical protein
MELRRDKQTYCAKESKKNARNMKNCGKGEKKGCESKRKIYKEVNKRAEKHDWDKHDKVEGRRK